MLGRGLGNQSLVCILSDFCFFQKPGAFGTSKYILGSICYQYWGNSSFCLLWLVIVCARRMGLGGQLVGQSPLARCSVTEAPAMAAQRSEAVTPRACFPLPGDGYH